MSLAVILNLLDSPTPLLYNADSGIRVKSGTVNDPIKPQASRTINSSCGEQRQLRHTGDLYRVKISIALAIHSLDLIRSLDHSLFARLIPAGAVV